MGVQGIDTHPQLSRPLLLSCRIRLSCVDEISTRAQAEPGPTRLLPNLLGLPQTNELGGCKPTGRNRPSSHHEGCCLSHDGTHTTDAGHQLFHHQPAACRLKSRKSLMRTVTPLDYSASSSRLRLWEDSLTDVPPSVKMGLEDRAVANGPVGPAMAGPIIEPVIIIIIFSFIFSVDQ